MKCKTAVCSSVGMKRKVNQDNFFVNGFINEEQEHYILKSYFPSKAEQLLCICDGMGGEKNGEVASYIAVKNLNSYIARNGNLMEQFESHINTYVQSTNNAICTYVRENDGQRSGTTMVTLCISPDNNEAVVANIGDSKVFLYRNNRLKKISEDHNQAQSLVNLGFITEEEARTHRDKSKLTQHLGIFQEELILEPFFSDNIMLEKNDVFVVCSDGLTDMLDYNEIEAILKENNSLKDKCKKLVEEANQKGGDDNITVILSEVN